MVMYLKKGTLINRISGTWPPCIWNSSIRPHTSRKNQRKLSPIASAWLKLMFAVSSITFSIGGQSEKKNSSIENPFNKINIVNCNCFVLYWLRYTVSHLFYADPFHRFYWPFQSPQKSRQLGQLTPHPTVRFSIMKHSEKIIFYDSPAIRVIQNSSTQKCIIFNKNHNNKLKLLCAERAKAKNYSRSECVSLI